MDFKRFVAAPQSVVKGFVTDENMNSDTTRSNGVPEANDVNASVIQGCPFSRKYVTLNNIMDPSKTSRDTLHQHAVPGNIPCNTKTCYGSVMFPTKSSERGLSDILREAKDFLDQYYTSLKRGGSDIHRSRWEHVKSEIEKSGTYQMTFHELTFGAKTAWRNASRCIGRIQWSKITVFDGRHVQTAKGMFDMLCSHIKFATNNGILRSSITIFPPRTDGKHDFRIWNNLLIAYAGYKQADGSIVGDPLSVEVTEVAQKLGWKGKGGMFDVLPLILQANGQDPEYFVIPPDLVMEVPLKHPRFEWFEELEWKWFAVPAVSSMMLDCGGIQYTGNGFSGWYMNTEVAARDLCDSGRYNLLETVAKLMGLDTSSNMTLWKDQALVEINIAVLHSYKLAGVSMIDHHSASESFMRHVDNENRLRGGCPGDWIWIVPPVSGSLSPIFHQEMLLYYLKPSYEYQPKPWAVHEWKDDKFKARPKKSSGKKITFKELARAVKFSASLMTKALAKRVQCVILYASETGRSQHYANVLAETFNHVFQAQVLCMDEYNLNELQLVPLVLFVTSTFGNGDPPDNGENMSSDMHRAAKELQPLGKMLDNKSMPLDTGSRLNRENGRIMESVSPSAHTKATLIRKTSSVQILTGDLPKPNRRQSEVYEKPKPFENVHYSVFGLGSRAYPNFCAFARYIDMTMDELGAARVCKMGEGDELCGQDDSFNNWVNKVFQSCCDNFCVGDKGILKKAMGTLGQTNRMWVPGKYRLSPAEGVVRPLIQGLSETHKRKVSSAAFISKQDLQAKDSERQTILVKLDVRDAPELNYEPGDHLGVYASNKPEIVEDLISKLQGCPSPDERINLEMMTEITTTKGTSTKWDLCEKFPQPITLRQAFTYYLDITSPPTRDLLQQLVLLVTDPGERLRLEKLIQDNQAYDEWRIVISPNMVEFLDAFPSINPPASLLLSQLPLLQHRFYSISSSQNACPGEVHLTVAVLKYMKNGGEGPLHQGVCSTWLDSLEPGQMVPCFQRTAKVFHLPQDSTIPIILVGPGTGIAPFRGFWQQRLFDMEKGGSVNGDITLYFGCRNSEVDHIYKEEVTEIKKKSVMKNVYAAYSREKRFPKTYVQNLMQQNAGQVFEDVVKRNGHLYVCGDVSMANDVIATLEKIIAENGKMSSDAAHEVVVSMRDTNRLHEDIFGVTLRTFEVTAQKRKLSKRLQQMDQMKSRIDE